MSTIEPAFLTRAEVERQLNLSRTTVVKLVRDGDLTAYKFGRDLRFAVVDVKAYVEASRVVVAA